MKQFIVFSLALFVFNACSQKKEANVEEASLLSSKQLVLSDSQLATLPMRVAVMSVETISTSLTVNGTVEVPPQNLHSVSVPLGGFLKYSKLLPGMEIRKGEVMAVLEDPAYIQVQEDFLKARAGLELAKADYERQRELNETKSSSDKVLQQAKASYQSLRVEVSALRERLLLLSINPDRLTEESISRTISLYAPFHGFVSKVNVNSGQYVAPTDVLFELVNPSDIHLVLSVFEKDRQVLKEGQRMLAFNNVEPNQKFKGVIFLIGRSISTEKTIDVHCHFDQYSSHLIPGTYMTAEIAVQGLKVKAIPSAAVVSFEGQEFVFVQMDKNTFTLVPVQTGMKNKEWTEIVNAVDFDQKKIVVEPAYTLLMALKNEALD
jgi:cobalt-zinc-cadmium efflux system membrane fusion protein